MNNSWIDPYWLSFPPMSRLGSIGVAGVITVITIIGVLGNGLVTFIYSRNHSLRKKNVFALNLAVQELLGSLTYSMIAVQGFFFGSWKFGEAACYFYGFTVGFFAVGSIATLAMVSAERCLVICRPFLVPKITMRSKLIVVLLIYFYSFIVTVPPYFGWSRFHPTGHMWSCCFEFVHHDWTTRSYLFYLFTFGFIVPSSVILTSYMLIFNGIRTSHDNVRKMTLEMDGRNSVTNPREFLIRGEKRTNERSSSEQSLTFRSSPRIPRLNTAQINRSTETKITRMMLVIIGFFAISWLPYSAMALTGQIFPRGTITPRIVTCTSILAKMFVVYNPFIYGFRDHKFRQEIRKTRIGRLISRYRKTNSTKVSKVDQQPEFVASLPLGNRMLQINSPLKSGHFYGSFPCVKGAQEMLI